MQNSRFYMKPDGADFSQIRSPHRLRSGDVYFYFRLTSDEIQQLEYIGSLQLSTAREGTTESQLHAIRRRFAEIHFRKEYPDLPFDENANYLNLDSDDLLYIFKDLQTGNLQSVGESGLSFLYGKKAEDVWLSHV